MTELHDLHRIDYDREADIMSVDGDPISAFVALPCGRVAYVNTWTREASDSIVKYAARLERGRLQLVRLDG